MAGETNRDRALPARRAADRLRAGVGSIRRAGGLRPWFFYLPGPGPWIMSWLRKRWVLFRNPHAHIEFRGPVYLGPRFNLNMPHGGTFIVGAGVEFRRGFRADLGPDARITIGEGCTFTYDVVLSCDTSIEIGSGCSIAHSSYIVDGSHRFRDPDVHWMGQGYDYRPITIGEDVLVNSKCTVINSIGKRAIIGANAVVTRPIPPWSVAAGVPARVMERYGPAADEPLDPLPERSASSTSTSG